MLEDGENEQELVLLTATERFKFTYFQIKRLPNIKCEAKVGSNTPSPKVLLQTYMLYAVFQYTIHWHMSWLYLLLKPHHHTDVIFTQAMHA